MIGFRETVEGVTVSPFYLNHKYNNSENINQNEKLEN